jgi:hypothetical protein
VSTTDGVPKRALVGFVVAVFSTACGATTSDAPGNSVPEGGVGIDAGLSPDAKIEDCLSDEGVHVCGTSAGCYQAGPDCDCALSGTPFGPETDAGVPEVGVCLNTLDGLSLRPCGSCYDGEVCVKLYYDDPVCTSESLGRLLWVHGAVDRVLYADLTPYTGEPLPEPTECPSDNGELELCGGNCGGCGADQYCSGRSPTHPYGICVDSGIVHCDNSSFCEDGQACLLLATSSASGALFPSTCVNADSCASLASSVPGGAVCK